MNTLPTPTKDSPSEKQAVRAIEYVLQYRARGISIKSRHITAALEECLTDEERVEIHKEAKVKAAAVLAWMKEEFAVTD